MVVAVATSRQLRLLIGLADAQALPFLALAEICAPFFFLLFPR